MEPRHGCQRRVTENKPFGRLVAWDPVQQKAAWTQDLGQPWDGDTLATAGDLVLIGTAYRRFVADNAAAGGRELARAR